jgi:hypothetical protein
MYQLSELAIAAPLGVGLCFVFIVNPSYGKIIVEKMNKTRGTCQMEDSFPIASLSFAVRALLLRG